MIYSQWIQQLCSILEYNVNVTDPGSSTPTDSTAFNNIIPFLISYTENRMQRDLDFIATTTTATNGIMTANSRLQTLPSVDIPTTGNIPYLIGSPVPAGSIVTTTNGNPIVNVHWVGHGLSVGQNISFVNPIFVGGREIGGVYNIVGVPDANNLTINITFNALSSQSVTVIGNGIFVVCTQIRPIVGGVKMQPLEPVTRDFLDFCWPSDVSPGANILPVQWCPNDQSTILVGAAPDQAYGFEAVGTMRIPPLSSTNYSNFLTQQFPEMYLAASLIAAFGYQRQFGAESDDPKTAQSWEDQYMKLLSSAAVEETRKRFTNLTPSPSNPTSVKAA